ncbi:histidine kinase [Afipia sp. P52-10]|uniref:sensor histidine kinase n=1 Tax=Afipia sp. P52-10 TaxID=1429916 RepID=UPI0003DF18A0|nr:HAMP domain-containing sensor histidine kinase [Afipia sp. P52-10]ETR75633.1 histidine kinase [Afipia sp. P52-10]
MKTSSLFLRLSSAAAALLVLALTLAAFGLQAIFNQEIERRAASELGQIVKVVTAQVRIDAGGTPVLDVEPPDPRFETPYGGLYWQVGNADGQRARSRSLWDFVLVAPADGANKERRVADIDGPDKAKLLAVIQDISVPVAEHGEKDVALQVIAAIDRADIAESQRSLFRLLVLSLVALGVILAGAMTIFIRLALRPFDDLARGLQAIHGGTSRALSGSFPGEVQRVVDDLNRLIAFQDAAVDRAKTHAGDLAHGLKTPLAVLSAVARQAAGDGRKELAASIDEQVVQMRRQVDRVLARARAGIAAALGRKAIAVEPIATKTVRAFERLPHERSLRWTCHVAPNAMFAGEAGDLTEMLGNLLDNARKWAASRIDLTVAVTTGVLTVRVEDDGPGLAPELISQIARGQRWDETQPGTGFGLAITRDLAENYRGSLDLGRSELGGLCATIRIPFDAQSARR